MKIPKRFLLKILLRIFKKNYQNPFSRARVTGWPQTNTHSHHVALGARPFPPQTRSTSFRSARFASLATRVKNGASKMVIEQDNSLGLLNLTTKK